MDSCDLRRLYSDERRRNEAGVVPEKLYFLFLFLFLSDFGPKRRLLAGCISS